jgi:hypothetical protein
MWRPRSSRRLAVAIRETLRPHAHALPRANAQADAVGVGSGARKTLAR